MENFNSSSRKFLCFLTLLLGLYGSAEAQNTARVEKIQRTVEKQPDKSSSWANAPKGTVLVEGDKLRTGKRSKSDVRFADKSLLRLGQLSSLEMRGAREMRLIKGQLLFSALSPARILAGNAAAAIKGTVPLIQVSPNGDAEFTLYIGSMDITSPQGTRTLNPGEWIRVYADGRFSEKRSATPFLYINGKPLDILLTPVQEPFMGSSYDIQGRDLPIRQLFDHAVTALSPEANDSRYNPFVRSRVSPEPTRIPAPTATPVPTATPAPTATPLPTEPTDPTGNALTILAEEPEEEPTPPLAAVSTRRIAAAVESGQETGSKTAAAVAPANSGEEHLGQVDQTLGSISQFDLTTLAAGTYGGGNGNFLGARFGASQYQGRVNVDLAVTPVRIRENGRLRETGLVTQALVMYRTDKYEVQLGRQHILDGPVQAVLFGNMLRQGGRNTFDAARLTLPYGDRFKFDLAYLVDAYPNLFASDVSGRQRGFYGRAEIRDERFAAGLNILKFTNAPVSNSTGATVDFAIPLAQDAVEVYGEVGRDPFKRKSQTFGLNFPILYEKAGVDLFLETGRLKSSSTAAGPNQEYAARLYKGIGSNVNLLVAVNKFENSHTRFILGFTLGGSRIERDDLISTLTAR